MDISNHCQYFGTYSFSLCSIHTHTHTHMHTNTHLIFLTGLSSCFAQSFSVWQIDCCSLALNRQNTIIPDSGGFKA